MKKRLKIIALVFCLIFYVSTCNVNAGFVGQRESISGRYTGPQADLLTTVQAILQNPYHEMRVTVQGYLIRQLSHEKYIFKDETGEIVVDIDQKYMPRQDITQQVLIRIEGEVEIKYKRNSIEIEAHRVDIIKQ